MKPLGRRKKSCSCESCMPAKRGRAREKRTIARQMTEQIDETEERVVMLEGSFAKKVRS